MLKLAPTGNFIEFLFRAPFPNRTQTTDLSGSESWDEDTGQGKPAAVASISSFASLCLPKGKTARFSSFIV